MLDYLDFGLKIIYKQIDLLYTGAGAGASCKYPDILEPVLGRSKSSWQEILIYDS